MAAYAVAGAGDTQVVAGPTELHGYTVACTTAPAALVLHDGTSAAGPPVVFVEFAAVGSHHVHLPAIDIGAGVWVERAAGVTVLTVYHS